MPSTYVSNLQMQSSPDYFQPGFLTSMAIALLIILTQNMFRAFLTVYFFVQCEKPESRFYQVLRTLVRNPGQEFKVLVDKSMSVESDSIETLEERILKDVVFFMKEKRKEKDYYKKFFRNML